MESLNGEIKTENKLEVLQPTGVDLIGSELVKMATLEREKIKGNFTPDQRKDIVILSGESRTLHGHRNPNLIGNTNFNKLDHNRTGKLVRDSILAPVFCSALVAMASVFGQNINMKQAMVAGSFVPTTIALARRGKDEVDARIDKHNDDRHLLNMGLIKPNQNQIDYIEALKQMPPL